MFVDALHIFSDKFQPRSGCIRIILFKINDFSGLMNFSKLRLNTVRKIRAIGTSFFLRIVHGRKGALWVMGVALIFLTVSCRKNETGGSNFSDPHQAALEELTTRYEKGDTAALEALVRMMRDCPDKNACGERAESLAAIAAWYANAEFFPLAIELYKAGQWAAEKSGKEEIRVAYYVELAFNYFKTENEDSLQHYLALSESLPSEHLSRQTRTSLLLTKGFMAEDQNKYLEAIDYYLRAYSLVKGQQSVNEAAIKENIGVMYMTLKHYSRALSYLRQSVPIYEKAGDTSRLIRIYSNLGVAYKNLDSLTLAASMHTKSLALAEKNSFAHARGLANYGNVLLKMGDYGQARMAFDSSTAICERLGISYGVLVNKINISHLFLEMKKPREAIEILEEIQDSPFLNQQNTQLEVSEIYLRAYEQLNDIRQIVIYQKKIIDLKNALYDSGEERLALEWEERFLRQIKENELAEMSNELNISRQQQKLGILGGSFALLTLLFIIRLFYLRKQKQQLHSKLLEEEKEKLRLQLELKERELTSQVIHLQSIGAFTDDVSSKLALLRNKLKGESADELTRIIRNFENGMPEELWDDFRLRFEKVNEGFHQNLLNLAPDLTPVEIKIASFLRLNLSSKEISRLTNRSAGTISNTRSSLRKKLHLEDEENLVSFLMSL